MSIPLTSAGNHSASKLNEVKLMFKSVFAATAALSMSAGAALAGPYVNVEANASWAGDDYTGATTDIHVGYEGTVCLLYTSPSPRDYAASRMPSSA